jgi:hypothetical protein
MGSDSEQGERQMAKAQAATMTVSLEDMEADLQTIQKERVRIEEKLDLSRKQKDEKLAAQLPLKQKLAAGDKSASAALDRLDAEIRDLVRVEDVLRQAEASIAPEIVAQQAQVNQLRRDLAEEERAQRFDADCAALTTATDEFLAAHTVATEKLAKMYIASFILMEWEQGPGANERLMLQRLANPVHALQMSGWKEPQIGAYVKRDFTVHAMLPPAKPVLPSAGVTQFEQGQGPGNAWNRNFRPRS